MSRYPAAAPASAPPTRAVAMRLLRYPVAANGASPPTPWNSPYKMVTRPHWAPSSAETAAATVSVKNPAPGLRITSGPRTAGISQTPLRMARAGGYQLKALSVPAHSRSQAKKTTPKAIARMAATTMSTVRQRLVVMNGPPGEYQEKTHATPEVGHGAAGGPELPALALPRSGSRVCGGRAPSQAWSLPLLRCGCAYKVS